MTRISLAIRPTFVAAMVAFAACGVGYAVADTVPDGEWDTALAAAAMPMRLEGEGMRPAGEGGEYLLEATTGSELVLFGETHGTVEIAELARGLYRATSGERGRVLVTEIGPATALAVEELVRRGSYERYLRWRMNLMAVPFYNLKAEAPLLHQAVRQTDSPYAAIWGLDQEFMAGAPIVARALRRHGSDGDTMSAVYDLYFARWYNPFLIGLGDGKELRELRDAFSTSDSEAAWRITEQLLLSHRIYQEQMGGDADWSNRRREQLMWDNFQHHLRMQVLAGQEESQAEGQADGQADGQGDDGSTTSRRPPGRFFFKFGAYHLFRGEGPTVEEPLGLRLSRWADDQGMRHVNLMVECAGGEALEPLFGGSDPCQAYLHGPADGFSAHLADAPYTVFDLRPLREHPGLSDQHPRVRQVVSGYDLLVLARDVTPARYLEGRMITYWYGVAAIILLLLVLTAVVWIGVHLWRGRRRRPALR